MGIKPLYVKHDEHGLVFRQRLKACVNKRIARQKSILMQSLSGVSMGPRWGVIHCTKESPSSFRRGAEDRARSMESGLLDVRKVPTLH